MSASVGYQLFGALLAIIGGFFGVVFRVRLERKEEVNQIKISLRDELDEVVSIIAKMNETFTTTQIVSNSYLNDLTKTTDAFTFHKQRIFLVKNELLRKEIVAFYKKLNKNIADSINKVGTLKPGEVSNDGNLVSVFNTISSEASELCKKIQKYQYRVLWINKK